MSDEKRQASKRQPAKRAKATSPRGQYRSYSDQEKAAALEMVNLCGGNVERAADLADIPMRTLAEWAKGHCVPEKVFADFAAKKAGRLTAKVQTICDRLADALLDEENIDKARFGELVTGFGVAFDKLRLMAGQPTNITENRSVEALREEAKLILRDYVAHVGDEARAKELLAEDFPEMASALVQ